MAASHQPSAIPELQKVPSNPQTPQYLQEFNQQHHLAEHLASKPQQQQ